MDDIRKKAIEAAWEACDQNFGDGPSFDDYTKSIQAYERAMWQKIETAPKDGTHIRITDGKQTFVALHDGESDWWWVLDYRDMEPSDLTFTKWQPLPDTPHAT